MPGTKAKSIGRFMDPGLAANQTVAALHRLQKLSRRSWGLGGVVQTRPRPKALPKSRRLGGKRSPAEGVATDPNFGGSTLSYRDGSTTTGGMPPGVGPLPRYVNQTLVAWAMRKFKRSVR